MIPCSNTIRLPVAELRLSLRTIAFPVLCFLPFFLFSFALLSCSFPGLLVIFLFLCFQETWPVCMVGFCFISGSCLGSSTAGQAASDLPSSFISAPAPFWGSGAPCAHRGLTISWYHTVRFDCESYFSLCCNTVFVLRSEFRVGTL